MNPNIINTSGVWGSATDFSSISPYILINTSGYSLSNPSKLIINTKGGTDFSSVRIAIIVNSSGNYPF